MVAQAAIERKPPTRRHDITIKGHTYEVLITPAGYCGLARDLIQVSSKSDAGLWIVDLGDERRPRWCACTHFYWKLDCTHLLAASEAIRREVAARREGSGR